MGAYCMDDCPDAAFIAAIRPEIFLCNPCPFLLVWNSGFLFQRAGNIVKESGRNEDPHICTFCFSDLCAEAGDT